MFLFLWRDKKREPKDVIVVAERATDARESYLNGEDRSNTGDEQLCNSAFDRISPNISLNV